MYALCFWLSRIGIFAPPFSCWNIGEIDGEEYAIMADGHHTMTAARELGIEIIFDIGEEPDGLTGETALEVHWNDGDWYIVEESNPAYEEYTFVW